MAKINSYGQKLKANFAVAFFLVCRRFFYTAFLFQCTQAGGVGDFIEVVQTLADGAEITGGQFFDGFQSPAFGGREFGCKHPFKKDRFAVVDQKVKAQLEGEPTHDRRIKILDKVGGTDHNAVEVFHLMQQFIDLSDLPVALGAFAAL